MIPFVYLDGKLIITLKTKNKIVEVNKNHIKFNEIKMALHGNDEQLIYDLSQTNNVSTTFHKPKPSFEVNFGHLEDFIQDPTGRATIIGDTVYYNGEEVHDVIKDRIFQFKSENLPFEHLLRCIEKIYENPSYKSRRDLFRFLENKSLPITENGCFLAYKVITNDWLDKWTHQVDNRINAVPSMPRSEVDDDSNIECSKGYHCGTLEYVTRYGSGTDRIIIVKVDPRDVVSVPTRDAEKLRMCRYEVIKEFTGRLNKPYYSQEDLDTEDSYENEPEEDDYEDSDLEEMDEDWEIIYSRQDEHIDEDDVTSYPW